jgi:hypothetical protein
MTMTEPLEPPTPWPGRHVERALLATFALHAVAMLSMACLLLPMMPGGPTADDRARMAAIASHATLWRLGWLPWGLTAASDVALALAVVAWRRVPRGRAWAALLLTCAAVVPDQLAQVRWVTRGVELAREGDLAAYLEFEHAVFRLTGGWAAVLYTASAVAWCACFAGAGAWSWSLTRLSVPLYAVFAIVAVAPLLPPAVALPSWSVAAGNALCFVGLEAWLLLVLEQTARLARPDTRTGRHAPWRAPASRAGARVLDGLANSRALPRLLGLLPTPQMRSDIRNVAYVNYLVAAERLADLVPEGLELQRLGPDGAWAMMTFLTYRHGHFGPRLAGPLRRLFSSPVQSNWRIYVTDPRTGRRGISFVTTAVTTRLHALGGRLMSQAPMHLLARGEVTRQKDGRMRVLLDPGGGSAPTRSSTCGRRRPSRCLHRGPRASRMHGRCSRTPCRRTARCRPSRGGSARRGRRSIWGSCSTRASRSRGPCGRGRPRPWWGTRRPCASGWRGWRSG